jgi:hypothetical protein
MFRPRLPLLLLLFALPVFAADYYVSPTGADHPSGGSAANPWRTINYAIGRIGPGDALHLEGGATFVEDIYFAPGRGGTNGAPVTLTSPLATPATIRPATTNSDAIYVYNADYLTFSNLVFIGQGIGTNQKSGLNFYVDNRRYGALRFENLDCSGFGKNGLLIGGWTGTNYGFQSVAVVNSRFHHNDGAGFFIYGQYKTSHANLTVRDCQSDNNQSGDGILVNGVTGGLIERCVAHDNGRAGNGRVGIWTYGVDGVTIQFCESYNNRTSGSTDGGGFDFDGGTVNSLMQYNYSHGNDGPGFLFAQYQNALSEYGPLQNNIVRYNISVNDGRKNNTGGLLFWGHNSTDRVSTNDIYHNTIIMGGTASNGSPAAVRLLGNNFRGLRVRNNLFVADNGHRLINADNASATNLVWFHGNNWWTAPGTQFQIKWGSTIYSNLPAWRVADQERLPGNVDVGYNVDPRLAADYRLQADSPLIDAAQIAIPNPGSQDYFSNSIPQGATYDVGAHDTKPTVTIAATAPEASEYGPVNGAFTVTRTGGTVAPLAIGYWLSGSALAGTDYAALTTPVTIPAGSTNAVLTITPYTDALAEGDEFATATLTASNLYALGTATATVTIHDLPADAWRFQHFGGNPPGSADLDDPDADGLPNLFEYAFATHPLASNDTAHLPVVGMTVPGSTGYLTLTYRQNTNAVDLTFVPQAAGALTNGAWGGGPVEIGRTNRGEFEEVTVRDTVPVESAEKRFLRLRISR